MKSNKAKKKLSIKWKIFGYLIGFIVMLLVILWIFQIVYLDVFYKHIKTMELEAASDEIFTELEATADSDDLAQSLVDIAQSYNICLLITDEDGQWLYSCESTMGCIIHRLTPFDIQAFALLAAENGGSLDLEFQGIKETSFPDAFDIWGEESDSDMPLDKKIPENDPNYQSDDENKQNSGFFRKRANDDVEGVVRVAIVEQESGEEYYVFINSILTPVDATVQTLKVQLLYISIILIILAIFIALLISRRVSKSIIKVNESALELAKGNYDVSFEGKDYKEIEQLSDTLNKAAKELSKTEKLQRELISNVSHDLRTPLTMIIGYSEVMRDIPGENKPENVQVIIDEAKRLSGLVNDIMDISKLQAGVSEFKPTVYDLTESIEKVIDRYSKLIAQKGYEIVFEYDKHILVNADEFKIYQVVYNLINNAINYIGDDKKVVVRQIVKEEVVRIEVSDKGAGIPPEKLEHVWQRYYKVDKEHKRAVMGTGLGLSIVENIMKLHHADYGVESELGVGSTFWFELKYEK